MEESIACRGPCKKTWAKFGRSSFLRHIKQAKKCKEKYTETEINHFEHASELRTKNLKRQRQSETDKEIERNKKRENYDSEKERKRKRENYNSEKETERKRKNYNSEKETERKRKNYNPEARHEKYEESNMEKPEKSSTEENRLHNFNLEKQYGPIFTCLCCMRNSFRRSVKRITDNYLIFLQGSEMIQFLQTNEIVDETDLDNILKGSLYVHGYPHLCNTCRRYLDKLEMPAMCAKNSLEYAQIPTCLQIPNLERQLICRDLTFLKVRQLKYGMSAINDHVINVPIDDDDIIKTVNRLPRTEKNHGMVTVGLKRDMGLKKFHKLEMISPNRISDALVYLKENHPEYKDIKISDLVEWQKQFEEGKDSESDNKSTENEEKPEGNESESDDKSTENEEKPEGNPFTSVTCLLPENPLNDVVGKVSCDYNLFTINHHFFLSLSSKYF